jgi:cell division protein FtsB
MSRPDNEKPNERIEKTARELRKHAPRPSDALVSRVERLAERGATRKSRPARIQVSRRKLVFALAAALTLAVAGAIVHGELGQSPGRSASAVEISQAQREYDVLGVPSGKLNKSIDKYTKEKAMKPYIGAVPAKHAPASGSAYSAPPAAASTVERARLSKITTGNRLAELRAVLTLKVRNSDELSSKTAEAMKIARRLSGYVVSTQTNVPSRGVATSYLVLKVPATRSQDALIAISGLGKILSQNVSIEDVKATVTAQGKSIQTLKREIASLEQSLGQQTLTPQARSQLQIELARDRARLSSLKTQRTKDILRGRLATITLTLTTGDLPKLPATPSRIHKAIDRAWNGLSSEISWAATGIIVASPFLLLAAIAALLMRARRRREERRLLERSSAEAV